MNKKALIAMSGGVDSAVSALLTKKRGFECIGATMKLHNGTQALNSDENSCCSEKDVEDARKVAEKLGMPHYVFNFSDRFKENVIDKFVDAYENGRTPNPCVDCNRYLKFDKLFTKAKELGCDYVVTGHYARIEYNEKTGRYLLKKATDPSKDQSYVLYSLSQEQLSHAMFPLGGMNKTEARQLAQDNGFINAHKQDSQDICFVTDGTYSEFIESYTGKKYPEGDFVDKNGNFLGRHKGIIRYTVGQRKGLGIAFEHPLYVISVNPENNTVVLGENQDLFSTEVIAKAINLISVANIYKPIRVKAKVRYRQNEQWATAVQVDDDTLKINFDEPQRAITKGQAVVLYDGDTVVGGGTIV